MASRYVILCDCDGSPSPRVIATIDDYRDEGGRVVIQGHKTAKRSAANHRGGSVNVFSECGGPCGRPVDVSEVTAATVLDLIVPQVEQLAVAQLPFADIDAAEPREIDAWRVTRHAEVQAQLLGEIPARGTPIPAPTEYENRRVIPLGLWCALITKLPKDR